MSRLRKQVIDLAWPALLHGLLVTVVFLTDRIILGNFKDEALASMQISGPILWSFFSVMGAYGAGLLAVIGRSFGAKDVTRVQSALGAGLLFAIGAGVAVGVLGFLMKDQIAVLVADEGPDTQSARALAVTYMGIVFLSAPLQMMGTAATVSFQGLGDTRTPMVVSVIAGALNLLLSWLLVFGKFGLPELGMTGAAIGTVAAFSVNGLVLYGIIINRRDGYRLGAPSIRTLSRIFQVAGPAFAERGVFHTGYVLFTVLIARLGSESMTAHQALIAIESLGFIAAGAFGIAAGTLVAQRLGADKPEDAEEAAHLSAKLGLYVLGGVGVFFFVAARPLVSIFTDNPEIIELGANCLRIAAIAQPLMAVTDAYAGALRGAGDTKTPMIAAIGGPLLIRLSACYFLAYTCGLGLMGIWIGSTLDWLLRSAYLIYVFRLGKWKHIRV